MNTFQQDLCKILNLARRPLWLLLNLDPHMLASLLSICQIFQMCALHSGPAFPLAALSLYLHLIPHSSTVITEAKPSPVATDQTLDSLLWFLIPPLPENNIMLWKPPVPLAGLFPACASPSALNEISWLETEKRGEVRLWTAQGVRRHSGAYSCLKPNPSLIWRQKGESKRGYRERRPTVFHLVPGRCFWFVNMSSWHA